jgi:hypothetical protein
MVSAPSAYEDGEIGGMIGRGNQSTGRKRALMTLCPPHIPHDFDLDSNPGRHGGKPATNRLSYGSVICTTFSLSMWTKRILHISDCDGQLYILVCDILR